MSQKTLPSVVYIDFTSFPLPHHPLLLCFRRTHIKKQNKTKKNLETPLTKTESFTGTTLSGGPTIERCSLCWVGMSQGFPLSFLVTCRFQGEAHTWCCFVFTVHMWQVYWKREWTSALCCCWLHVYLWRLQQQRWRCATWERERNCTESLWIQVPWMNGQEPVSERRRRPEETADNPTSPERCVKFR